MANKVPLLTGTVNQAWTLIGYAGTRQGDTVPTSLFVYTGSTASMNWSRRTTPSLPPLPTSISGPTQVGQPDSQGQDSI